MKKYDLHKIMKAAHEIYRKYFKLYQLAHGVQTFGDCLKLACAVQQHGEHGAARRAVRFAVVTVADLAGLAGRSGGVSPAIVGRVGEFLFDPLDEGFGRLRGRRMGKADDEPAAAEDFFAAVQVFWGQIRDEIGDRHGNKV